MMGKKSGAMVVSVLLLTSISAVLVNSPSVSAAGSSSAASDSPEEDQQFVCKGLEVSKSRVESGEPVTTSVTVRNTGTELAFKEIGIYKDGEKVDTLPVTVGAGESRERTFSLKLWSAGVHEITIGNAPPKTVTVIRSPFKLKYSNFKCRGKFKAGKFKVSITVKNVGSLSGSEEVELYADDELVDSETVSLDAGKSRVVHFTPAPKPAVYRIENLSAKVPFVWIDEDKDDKKDADENSFISIGNATDAAEKGDVIVVKSGVYQTGIYEDSPMRIEKSNITIKSAEGPKKTKIVDHREGITLDAENVTMKGFTLKLYTDRKFAFELAGEGNHTLANCIAPSKNMPNYQYVWGESYILCHSPNNLIENCTVRDKGIGIGAQHPSSDNNTFSNNTLYDSSLQIWDEIRHNKVLNNVLYRGHIQVANHIHYTTISHNHIYGAGDLHGLQWTPSYGICLGFHPPCIGLKTGYIVDQSNNTVSNNVVRSSSGGIIAWGHSDNNTISNNLIASNGTAMSIGPHSENTEIHYNEIVGNESGIDSRNKTTDATLNWWGSPTGPSGAGTGTGDSVNENVEYSPWAAAEPGTEPMPLVYKMEVRPEKVENVEPKEQVEVTLSVESENIKVIPSIVTSPYYRTNLKPNQLKTSPAEWTFKVWPTDEAAGKDIKVRFELYADYFWRRFGPIPMVRKPVTLHVSSS